jgi:hypothetical protein
VAWVPLTRHPLDVLVSRPSSVGGAPHCRTEERGAKGVLSVREE